MKIKSAGGEFAFAATDELENRLGTCAIHARMLKDLLPERPYELEITLDCEEKARMHLLGAAMTRAMQLAKEQGCPSRVWAKCTAGDARWLDELTSVGFEKNDAIYRMRRRVVEGPGIQRLPQGCVAISDRLEDENERLFFQKRLEEVFGVDDPDAWLDDMAKKPFFARLLLASRDGLAGEAIVTGADGLGRIEHIYTAPAWRRKGVALYLMEAARHHFLRARLSEAVIDVRTRLPGLTELASSAGYRRTELVAYYPGIDL